MTDNPLWVREVRARMRGGKAYGLLFVYTLLLTLLSGIVYLQWFDSQQASGSGFTSQAAFEAGQLLYRTLFVTQAILIALITPSLTAGAITLEREQRTLEMMAITRLRPAQIITGKLVAAVAFVALLLTSSLPLASLVFLLGGVSPAELFFTYLVLLVSAALFGATGLLCSTLVRSTAGATALAHGAVGIFFVASLATGVSSTSLMAFRSVNAIGAVFHSTSGEHYFRATLPSWLIAVLLLGLLAALVANVAMTRLEYYDEPRPAPIRLLATTLWGLCFLLLIGNLYHVHVTGTQGSFIDPRRWIGDLALTHLAALLVLLPLFATGNVTGLTRGRYLLGMLPHRVLAGDLPSGVPLLGLWLVIPYVWFLLGCGLIDQKALSLFFDGLLPALFLTVAVVACYTAVGHCLSVWLPSRWSAMALCYALILAGTLLPLLAMYGWRAPPGPSDNTPQLLWQALYLTPFLGLYELTLDNGDHFWSNLPPMLLGRAPFWLVTAAVHFLGAASFVVATLAGLRRTAAPGAARRGYTVR